MSVDGREGSGPDGLARTRPERALLLAVDTGSAPWSITESLDELEELARTAGAEVVGRVSQRLDHPDPKTYLGRGKLNEARDLAVEHEADLIIVNHHLFFADLSLKQDDFGSILPEYSAVIFDEAHEIEDVASDYFGRQISNFRFEELARDAADQLRGDPQSNCGDDHAEGANSGKLFGPDALSPRPENK